MIIVDDAGNIFNIHEIYFIQVLLDIRDSNPLILLEFIQWNAYKLLSNSTRNIIIMSQIGLYGN